MRYLFLTLLLNCTLSFTHAQEWKKFTDTAGNFTAVFPDTWTPKIKENNHVFFTSPAEGDNDMFRQNINIIVTKSDALNGFTIRDLVPDLLKNLETQYDNYELISNKYFKWNGNESFEAVYNIIQNGDTTSYRIKQWMYLTNGVFYVVTYTAVSGPDAMAVTAEKILNSIKF